MAYLPRPGSLESYTQSKNQSYRLMHCCLVIMIDLTLVLIDMSYSSLRSTRGTEFI